MAMYGDLTGAAAAISASKSTSVAAMDSKYRLDRSATSGITRTEPTEGYSGGIDRREATNDSVVATKEVEVCTVPVDLNVI